MMTLTMEKFENVDYNELGFDPHIYGLLTGQSDLFRDEDFGANDLNLRSLMDQRGSSSDGSNLLQLMEFPSKTLWSKFSRCSSEFKA
ncbi:hypothetical protein Scep_025421 [Stephania cephalantha]|uniref:Uncharacterized protein n=1 Tax=Stephania cephalantha TaxID=152367 RepID=A0AAP0ELJ3_9MAGN